MGSAMWAALYRGTGVVGQVLSLFSRAPNRPPLVTNGVNQ